ncbi:MBL fold metallo-hydrolase [Sandaracinobacter sp. RS1-74]|uniref:alkyl/aryl-sulfatase n=1 Tax=Sandaracinobacteroides sayramensis TaxID=2913411 RepID=UPI001EDADCCF|nr:alkyl sulfatase dimerization domain-containing protein [Sandaracinobacteroides sayramensis]MCG2839568.1 MBL fold metallo-hydrolase [Sandaracinobacteroides sayramensis]
MKSMPRQTVAFALGITAMLLGSAAPAFANPATGHTAAANAKVLEQLPFNDRSEFQDAARGLLLKPDTLTIRRADGGIAWDLESYRKFIALETPAPASVNPSLWRNAQLNLHYGLFEVADGIYQVRGYDLANITFIRGDSGWIVADVGTTVETARAAYDLVTQKFGRLPIVGVIYSHPHVDHFSGIKGLVSEADVTSGKVKLVAPDGFLEHAISENVIAGNAMSRRASYMYGALLARNAEGSVGAGLGLTTPIGTGTLIAPNHIVHKTGEKLVLDGVEMIFQMTPGTEAPAEMNFYLPKQRAMWMAENTVSTMHNILTLRGAQVRDSLAWSKYINETIELFGDRIDVKFQSHHWPKWGNAEVLDYLAKQRDLYKFVHDRSVNLMNHGYTGEEISEMIRLPQSLENFWPGRGYYGTLRHNSRAVYQRYMGWYDGNPANLDNLPPEMAARKYVDYMGGEAAVVARARQDFAKGEYRWVATAMKHVVFANPESAAGKGLLADSLEQLGYQAESGPWRSVYLQGAHELRKGVPKLSGSTASPDVIRAMPPEMLFDYLAVRLNAEKAEGQKLALNMHFTDLDQTYALTVDNSVLNYSRKPNPGATATAHLSKQALDDVNLGKASIADKVKSGEIRIEGNAETLQKLMGLFDSFNPSFNIVTP